MKPRRVHIDEIQAALKEHGSCRAAGAALGISPGTIYNRAVAAGLIAPGPRPATSRPSWGVGPALRLPSQERLLALRELLDDEAWLEEAGA